MKVKTNTTMKKNLKGAVKMAKYFRSNATSLDNTLTTYEKKTKNTEKLFGLRKMCKRSFETKQNISLSFKKKKSRKKSNKFCQVLYSHSFKEVSKTVTCIR